MKKIYDAYRSFMLFYYFELLDNQVFIVTMAAIFTIISILIGLVPSVTLFGYVLVFIIWMILGCLGLMISTLVDYLQR